MACCRVSRTCASINGVLMAVVAAAGVVLFATRAGLVDWILQANLAIVPGTYMYPNWREFPVPIHTSIRFFNVTNAEAVQKSGAKPHLVEVGPYVYLEDHTKVKMVHNIENGTVTYQQVSELFRWVNY